MENSHFMFAASWAVGGSSDTGGMSSMGGSSSSGFTTTLWRQGSDPSATLGTVAHPALANVAGLRAVAAREPARQEAATQGLSWLASMAVVCSVVKVTRTELEREIRSRGRTSYSHVGSDCGQATRCRSSGHPPLGALLRAPPPCSPLFAGGLARGTAKHEPTIACFQANPFRSQLVHRLLHDAPSPLGYQPTWPARTVRCSCRRLPRNPAKHPRSAPSQIQRSHSLFVWAI